MNNTNDFDHKYLMDIINVFYIPHHFSFISFSSHLKHEYTRYKKVNKFNTMQMEGRWGEKNMRCDLVSISWSISEGNDSIDWKCSHWNVLNRFSSHTHILNNDVVDDVRLNALYSKYHKNIHSSIKCNELSHSLSIGDVT